MSTANVQVPEPHRLLPVSSTTPPLSERDQRVLIVHGDDSQRLGLVDIAADEGWDCMDVSDADEVPRLVAEYEPDLILMATDLPDVSGYEVCGELRASDLQGHTPIILMGEPPVDEDAVARGLLAGADDFITDPSRLVELRARVRVQLRNKRYRDALVRVRSERDHLRRDASTDPLTGTLNRRSLERVIHEAFDSGQRFAVLFVDVDHFKAVNDEFGHDIGDQVLRVVAEWLKAGIRPGDHCGRYGGEEFLLIVAGAGRESARLVAERHRQAIEALTAEHTGGPERVTISIGVSVFDPRRADQTAESMLRDADAALYEAKRAGRNRVAMTASDLPVSSRRPPRRDTPPSSPGARQTVERLHANVVPRVAISDAPATTAASPVLSDVIGTLRGGTAPR